MPIPAILAGLGIAAAGIIGVGGHLSAQEKNELAQKTSAEAQKMYDTAKESLENAQKKTESSLLQLGYSKKRVLETSINQFLVAYDRIKNIELSESKGLDEIKNFVVDQQDALQLREMANIYESSFSSAVAGAATGAVIALAASGSLPAVTGALATAEFGTVAGIAGSALSFGATITPLAAIAAPVVLFTGISSSIKAEENLEKANVMYAEAKAATEKMKTAEVMCTAIAKRADMFDELLLDLNGMFSQCTGLLDAVTKKKSGFFKRKIDVKTLTEDEKKLIATTRALAGAVKAVIDTPILSGDGTISKESQKTYTNTSKNLPAFSHAVAEIDSCDYKVTPIVAKPPKHKHNRKNKNNKPSTVLTAARNVFAIVLACFVSFFVLKVSVNPYENNVAFGLISFTATVLLVMNTHTGSKLFNFIKIVCFLGLSIGTSMLFYIYCGYIIQWDYYIITCCAAALISIFLFGASIPDGAHQITNFRKMLINLFGYVFLFACGILIYSMLYNLIGISNYVSSIIAVVLYGICALIIPFVANEQ